ncbi:MAG: methyltransferase domain-containing protein [bacterium]|nr:methyltransferase domain-containing protein [bacterium]
MLKFDAWQRCETTRHLLNWAMPDDGALVLDVGGYPGRMRTFAPRFEWVLCDPRVDAPGMQLRGSAMALPFRDGAFEFAVSLDVFEHLPPLSRLTAIDEMRRVARRGLLLSFPHAHPNVKAAEDAVRAAHVSLRGEPHPWLDEHAQFDLPDAEALIDHLRASGGAVKAFDVGSVERWMRLQMLDLLLETAPDSVDLAQTLDTFYQEELFGHDFRTPAYRKIVLCLFDEKEPLSVDLIQTPREDESAAEIAMVSRLAEGLIGLHRQRQREEEEARLRWEEEQAALKPEPAPTEAADEPGAEQPASPDASAETAPDVEPEAEPVAPAPPETVPSGMALAARDQAEYIRRLEQGLRAWEETYQDALRELTESYAWRDRLEKRFSFRVFRRVMRMLGKSVGE